MSKKLRTPIIMPRKQGGTFYTFGSAMEDIGLNVNENNNKVELSHYVLLDLPKFSYGAAPSSNTDPYLNLKTNMKYDTPQYTTDPNTQGDFIFAESFQNYCLNFETIMRNQDTYNYASNKTVSERIFWKWLFNHLQNADFSNRFEYTADGKYFYETPDKAIVKGFGAISAGSQRTDDSGLYNETFVQIPSSYGQMRVLFKNVIDENYYEISYDHPDYYIPGTNIDHYIENIDESETEYGNIITFHMASVEFEFPMDGALITDYSTQSQLKVKETSEADAEITCEFVSDRKNLPSRGYLIINDSSVEYNNITCDVHDYVLKSTGISPVAISDFDPDEIDPDEEYNNDVPRYRILASQYDCLEVELDITKLREEYDSSTLTYDDLGTGRVNDPSYVDYGDYTFNAILVYYSIYDANKTKRLATNAYGLYILDGAIDTNQNDNCFYFPSIVKTKSVPNVKIGSSYSFRINVKPTTAYNGDVIVNDNATAAYSMSEDFNDVLHNLTSAITALRENTKTLYNIAKDNKNIKEMAVTAMEKLSEIETDVSNIKKGNFPYTADSIYKPENDGNFILTSTIAKNVLNKIHVRYNSKGEVSMSMNTTGLTGYPLKIAQQMQKSLNEKNYIDIMYVISLLVARSGGVTVENQMKINNASSLVTDQLSPTHVGTIN